MKVTLRHNVSVFLRNGGNVGCIVNRYNLKNCTFNGTGADFLSTLEYQPKSTKELVEKKLLPLYASVSSEELLTDFEDFVCGLEAEGYVEIDKGKSKRRFFCPQITIELTNGCNERCIHCYLPNSVKTASQSLSKEEITKIIDEYAALGGKLVSFTGGEALLSPNISLVRYAHEKGLNTSVLSNLTVLSCSHIQLFAECNTSVQTSLYSTSPAEHDAITLRRGSCEQTMNAIRRLRNEDVPVRISCILMKENPYAYKGVVAFAHETQSEIQVSYALQAQINGDESNLSHRLPHSQLREILYDLIANYRDTLKPVLVFDKDPFIFEDWLHSPICAACNDTLYITSSGDIQPCPGWGKILGNINRASLNDVFRAIGDNSEIPFTREMFPQCFNCDVKDFCSFCLSFNAAENGGDYRRPSSYLCEIAKIYKDVYNELKEESVID